MSERSAFKQPFMPFFHGDFLAATSEWEGIERSLYLTLLAYQWSQGSLPSEPRKLARLADWDRDLFDSCWRQVSQKFVQIDGRLINPRLEQHRARSKELSAKNAAAGKKGADAKWRKDSERHAKQMASATAADGERSGAAIVDANRSDGERQNSAIAIHPDPSHSIPSDSTPSQDSERAGARGGDGPAITRRTWTREQIAEANQVIRDTYPRGTYRENVWLIAARNIERLIDEGLATPFELIEAATAYRDQQIAAGKAGSQFVLGPGKFYEPRDGNWRGPFPKPVTKAQAAQDANIAAGLTWLQRSEGTAQ